MCGYGDRVATSPRRSVLAVACLALIGVVVATLPTASDVVASDQAKVANQLKETGEALDNANRQVKRAMGAWNRANDRLPAARAKLRTAKQTEAEARQTQRIAEAKFRSAESALQINLNRQDATKRRITDIQSKMDSVARGLYQRGPFAEVDVILSASDPGDFTLRLAALNSIGRDQARIGNELATVQADLVMQGVQREALKLAAEQDATKATQAAERARQARLAATQAERQIRSLVAAKRVAAQRAKQHRGAVQARYQRLKVEQARIQRAAVAAARREAARLAALKRQGQSNGDAPTTTGGLRWPVDGGRISGHVGPRVHPIYGYNSCHTGMDIAAPSGTSVFASADGTVASIGSGGPYGTSIMVAHGDGLTTFYAHLSSVAVSQGQQVNAGQRIGGVGSTGWSTGPHLHYETRINGTAYDPMGWFGGSRRTVGC
jgi:murein DD-endopeptidase MepM/ murein hydrolase activator NlpD